MKQIFVLFSFCLLFLSKSQVVDSQINSTGLNSTEINNRVQQIQNSEKCTDCLQQNSSNSAHIAVIVCTTIFTVLFVSMIACFVCSNKIAARFSKRLRQKNQIIPMLRQKYDTVSSGRISQSQFQANIKNIVKLFEQTFTKTIFGYKSEAQNQNKYSQINLNLKKQNSFHYSLSLQAKDKNGQWCGSGSILQQPQGIFIWFTQQYYDITKMWKKDIRIFYSTKVTENLITGRWYAYKGELDQNFVGTWSINLSMQNLYLSQDRMSQDLQQIE